MENTIFQKDVQFYDSIDKEKLKISHTYMFESLPNIFLKIAQIKFSEMEDQTMEFTEELDSDTVPLPMLVSVNTIQAWKIMNDSQVEVYIKDEYKIISQLLSKGGQGTVYQGIDTKSNQFLVFKQFTSKQDYENEKNIYQQLQNSEVITKCFIYLDSMIADDEFQLLILPKAECDLLTFMQLNHKDHFQEEENKNKDQNKTFHLDKNSFISLLQFQINAMQEFKKVGLYLQDNKPDNILVKQEFFETQQRTLFRFVYTDFGAAFKIGKDKQSYPSFATRFFYNKKLHQQKQKSNNIEYTDKEILQNELFTIARSLQVILFPFDYQQNQLLAVENMDEFCKLIQENYQDQHLIDLFQTLYKPEKQENINSFEDIVKCIKEYEIKANNPLMLQHYTQVQYWDDDKESIKNWKNQKIQEFYEKQFQNLEYDQVYKRSNYLFDKNLLREAKIGYKILLQKFEMPIHYKAWYFNRLGVVNQLEGDTKEARKYFEQCLDLEKQGEIEEKYIQTFNNSEHNLLSIILENEPIEYAIQKHEEIAEKNKKYLNTKQQSILASNYSSLALALNQSESRRQESEKYYKLSIELTQKTDSQYPDLLTNYANYLANLEKFEQAIELVEEALEMVTNKYGLNHRETAFHLQVLGSIKFNQGNYKEGSKLLQDALKITLAHYGQFYIKTIDIYKNLIICYQKLEDINKVHTTTAQLFQIYDHNYGKESAQIIQAYSEYASFLYRNKYLKESGDYYNTLIYLKEKHNQEDKDYIAYIQNAATIYFNLYMFEESIQFYDILLTQLEKLGNQEETILQVLQTQGFMYKFYWNYEEAEKCYQKIVDIRLKLNENKFNEAIIQFQEEVVNCLIEQNKLVQAQNKLIQQDYLQFIQNQDNFKFLGNNHYYQLLVSIIKLKIIKSQQEFQQLQENPVKQLSQINNLENINESIEKEAQNHLNKSSEFYEKTEDEQTKNMFFLSLNYLKQELMIITNQIDENQVLQGKQNFELAETLRGSKTFQNSVYQDQLGYILLLNQQYQESQQILEDSLKLIKSSIAAEENQTDLQPKIYLSILYQNLEKYQESHDLLNEVLNRQPKNEIMTLKSLIFEYINLQNLEKSEENQQIKQKFQQILEQIKQKNPNLNF